MGDAEDVAAIEEHWPQALAHRDRAWLEEHTEDDFVFITPGGVVIDRDSYLERSQVPDDAIVSRVNKAEETRLVGDDVAVVIGRLEVRSRVPDDQERGHRYRYSSVYVRSGGIWRASTAQLTPLPDDGRPEALPRRDEAGSDTARR